MALLIVAGILPAIFLVGIGQAFRPIPGRPGSSATWTGYLLSALLLLLVMTLISYNLLGERGSMLLMLALPSALGVISQTIIWLAQSRLAGVGQSRRLLALLMADLLLLAGLIPLTDPFIGVVLIAGSLLLTMFWALWERAGRGWVVIYLLVILAGLLSGWRIDLNRDLFPSIPWLARTTGMLTYLFIMVEVLVLFWLLAWALQGETYPNWRKLARAGLLALPILGLASWQIATSAAWDVATDGLGGIALLQISGMAGIAAAILAAWRLPALRRTPVFILGMALPIYMMAWMSFGTFGLDGPWGRVPIARTERRAASIERAILRYHDRNGSYPTSLQDLTPGYLLILPTPFIIPGQDWCYQGGAGFYRLGFVQREFFSAPASVRVFAAEGQPPNPAWACDEQAARYPAPPGFYEEP